MCDSSEPKCCGTKQIVTWRFMWRQRRHIVELHHSPWGRRKVFVNLKLELNKRGIGGARYDLRAGWSGSDPTVAVGVQIKWDGSYAYDLFIEGRSFVEAHTRWLHNADA